MTEQDRIDFEHILEKDPVGVIAIARQVLATTPEARRRLTYLEADMRCVVELEEEGGAAEEAGRPRRRRFRKNR